MADGPTHPEEPGKPPEGGEGADGGASTNPPTGEHDTPRGRQQPPGTEEARRAPSYEELIEKSWKEIPEQKRRIIDQADATEDLQELIYATISPKALSTTDEEEKEELEAHKKELQQRVLEKADSNPDFKELIEAGTRLAAPGDRDVNIISLLASPEPEAEENDPNHVETQEEARRREEVERPAKKVLEDLAQAAKTPDDEAAQEKLKEAVLPIADKHYLEELRKENKFLYGLLVSFILTVSLGAGAQYAFAAAVEAAAKSTR